MLEYRVCTIYRRALRFNFSFQFSPPLTAPNSCHVFDICRVTLLAW